MNPRTAWNAGHSRMMRVEHLLTEEGFDPFPIGYLNSGRLEKLKSDVREQRHIVARAVSRFLDGELFDMFEASQGFVEVPRGLHFLDFATAAQWAAYNGGQRCKELGGRVPGGTSYTAARTLKNYAYPWWWREDEGVYLIGERGIQSLVFPDKKLARGSKLVAFYKDKAGFGDWVCKHHAKPVLFFGEETEKVKIGDV